MKKILIVSLVLLGALFSAAAASGNPLYMVKETRTDGSGTVNYYGGEYATKYAGKAMPKTEAERVARNVDALYLRNTVEVLVWDGRALKVWQSTR
jgi:hypothetical protein